MSAVATHKIGEPLPPPPPSIAVQAPDVEAMRRIVAPPAERPRARILDVTTAAYHRDPCEVPSLSSSMAKVLIDQSPLHAFEAHPRFGNNGVEGSKAMDEGDLLHAILLLQDLSSFVVLPFDSFRTKAAQAARDEAEAAGKLVLLEAAFDKVTKVAETAGKRMTEMGIVLDGVSEMKVEWTEVDGPERVLCRGMMDHVRPVQADRSTTVYDLKSTRSGDLRSIAKHIIDYGYDIQGAAYKSAIGKLRPESLGRVDVVVVFIESFAPYAVTPVRFSGELRGLGEMKWERACRTWAECLRTRRWPGYVDAITVVEPPMWALLEPVL